MHPQISLQNLNKIFNEAEARAKAAIQIAVKEYTDAYQVKVKNNAPSDEILKGYKESIVSASIEESVDAAVVVEDTRETETVGSKDKDFTLIYAKSTSDKKSKLLEVLEKFGPFAVDFFPVKNVTEDIKLEYRLVRASEVKSIKEINRQNTSAVNSALMALSITPEKIDSEAEVKEDLVFKILRAEAGLNKKISPHWRPNLFSLKRQFNSGVNFADILSNPNAKSYKLQDKSDNQISVDTAEGLEGFQKSIS